MASALRSGFARPRKRNENGPTASLLPATGNGLVDQHAPHHFRRDGVKMSAILPLHRVPFDRAQIDLADQICRLEGGAGRFFFAQVGTSQATELRFYQGCQPLERILIALAPGIQQLSDFTGGVAAY